jgi:hypothetical protein
MPDVNVKIHPGVALINAIDRENGTHLEVGEMALAIHFDNDSFFAYLCLRDNESIGYVTMNNGINLGEKLEAGLYALMKSKFEKRLKDKYGDLDEFETKDGWRRLWDTVHSTLYQFTRCDVAAIHFKCEGIYMLDRLGIDEFNGVLEEIVQDAKKSIEDMLHSEYGSLERDYSFDDISHVYIGGSMSDHPYLWKAFSKLCDAPVHISGEAESVIARGAALAE